MIQEYYQKCSGIEVKIGKCQYLLRFFNAEIPGFVHIIIFVRNVNSTVLGFSTFSNTDDTSAHFVSLLFLVIAENIIIDLALLNVAYFKQVLAIINILIFRPYPGTLNSMRINQPSGSIFSRK